MSRNRTCGRYPPAKGYEPYCPACDEYSSILPSNLTDDQAEAAYLAIDDKLDRIQRIHTLYRSRR